MATTERLDFSQPDNELSQIAEQQRQRLIPKNDYKTTNQYKGTGSFLDTTNGGSSIDKIERINEIKINEYQKDKPYTTPSA
jgi:hypothetical protein